MVSLYSFVFLMITAGWVLKARGLVRAEAASDINQIVFYLTLPPTIVLALHKAELSGTLWTLPATAWALMGLGFGTGWVVGKALGVSRATLGTLMLLMGFANNTFFGYPIISSFHGQEGLTLAIFYDLPGNTLAVNTVGMALAATYGGEPVPLRRILVRLLGYPTLWALGVGLLVRGVMIPPWLETLMHRVGDMTIPLIMLSLGLSFEPERLRERPRLVAAVVGFKLVVAPLCAWGIARMLGMSPLQTQVTVLQAGMPVMLFAITLGMLFKLDLPLMVSAVMVSALLSLISLPLIHWVFGHWVPGG